MGAVLTPSDTKAVADVAHRAGVPAHLDGARIFNAAVALEVPASALTKDVDSVSFCLSKGLSAPVGSLLCGGREFIDRARKYRKMVGGGMRQAGVLAAAGIVALNEGVGRLAEDHANARRLAQRLATVPGLRMDPAQVQTNILILDTDPFNARDVVARMDAHGVKANPVGPSRFRLVTHRMVTAADVDDAADRIARAVREVVGGRV
jgi:threonine aldolase